MFLLVAPVVAVLIPIAVSALGYIVYRLVEMGMDELEEHLKGGGEMACPKGTYYNEHVERCVTTDCPEGQFFDKDLQACFIPCGPDEEWIGSEPSGKPICRKKPKPKPKAIPKEIDPFTQCLKSLLALGYSPQQALYLCSPRTVEIPGGIPLPLEEEIKKVRKYCAANEIEVGRDEFDNPLCIKKKKPKPPSQPRVVPDCGPDEIFIGYDDDGKAICLPMGPGAGGIRTPSGRKPGRIIERLPREEKKPLPGFPGLQGRILNGKIEVAPPDTLPPIRKELPRPEWIDILEKKKQRLWEEFTHGRITYDDYERRMNSVKRGLAKAIAYQKRFK